MDKRLERLVKAGLLSVLDEGFLGGSRNFFCYRAPDGREPAREFLKSLNNKVSATYAVLFRKFIAQAGQLRGERWKKLETDLFEFKDNASQTRLIHTTDVGSAVILLFGFGGKKENKIKKKHINEAVRLRDDYQLRRDQTLKGEK